MEPRKAYYEIQAKMIINNCQKRGFEAYYCEDVASAQKKLLQLLGEKKTIAYGGSMTIDENGFKDELIKQGHELIKREDYHSEEEIQELKRRTISADAFIMSTNAITIDGQLINTDGTSNRICYLMYGPKEVYVIAGMNKVVKDVDAGIERIKREAAPINAIRLQRDTPCAKNGICGNCYEGTICCNTVITRASRDKGRVKILLIGENLGY